MTETDKHTLIALARESIEASLFDSPSPLAQTLATTEKPPFSERRGCFVTLHTRRGQLRGCIGTIMARERLAQSVVTLAREAAFADPRFPPVTASEWPTLDVEISVLTELAPIEDYRMIRVGADGVLLTLGMQRAVFLPQVVTEQGWDLEELLTHLSMKAGLAPDAYQDPRCRFEVFQAEVFRNEDHL